MLHVHHINAEFIFLIFYFYRVMEFDWKELISMLLKIFLTIVCYIFLRKS